MNNRDNFTEKVKQAVAARAGWLCSFSGCGKLTVGPSEEAPEAVAKIGEAAHICAASQGQGARRYDAMMTPDERAGFDNAIWLCSDHAKLIDRDEVTYTADVLRMMKREHEAACARCALRVKRGYCHRAICGRPGCDLHRRPHAHGGGSWTVRLKHFLTGDVHKIISFVDGFTREAAERKYILSNEIGDGRMLVAAPSLTKQSNGYSLICTIAPSVPRVDAQKIGSSIATDPETNDWILDAKGGVATVSGVDYLPQRVREVLSIQRNESPFYPTFGMRFFEYFEAFRGSPWLDLLFKLDVVRQASIPFNDTLTGQMQTPLQRVMRVRGLDLLADKPTKN
jgi:hypothetical protein